MRRASTSHEFQDGCCIHCGAMLDDAKLYRIGCEAGPDGNQRGYHGFALTPDEQAAGVTTLDKALADSRRDK